MQIRGWGVKGRVHSGGLQGKKKNKGVKGEKRRKIREFISDSFGQGKTRTPRREIAADLTIQKEKGGKSLVAV